MDIVTEIINAWDPIDLLEMGAPDDEYSVEVRKIKAFFKENKVSVEVAAAKIREIFEMAFFEDLFECSDEECRSVALQLLELDW